MTTIDDLYTRLLCLFGLHAWALTGTLAERGSLYALDRCSRCNASHRHKRFLRRKADRETGEERSLREAREVRATPTAEHSADSLRGAFSIAATRAWRLRRAARKAQPRGPRLSENPALRPTPLPASVRERAQILIYAQGTGPETTDAVLASGFRTQPPKPRNWVASNGYGRSDARGLRGPHAVPRIDAEEATDEDA